MSPDPPWYYQTFFSIQIGAIPGLLDKLRSTGLMAPLNYSSNGMEYVSTFPFLSMPHTDVILILRTQSTDKLGAKKGARFVDAMKGAESFMFSGVVVTGIFPSLYRVFNHIEACDQISLGGNSLQGPRSAMLEGELAPSQSSLRTLIHTFNLNYKTCQSVLCKRRTKYGQKSVRRLLKTAGLSSREWISLRSLLLKDATSTMWVQSSSSDGHSPHALDHVQLKQIMYVTTMARIF